VSSLLEVPLTRRMHRLPVVRLVHGRAAQRAWSWDLRDQLTREWWPQGITWAGERLLVSWYSRRGAGSRVSVVDLVDRRYAHVPLLTPAGEPLRVHAGGLAWDDGWLYVAATARGFWALHVDDLAPAVEGVARYSGPAVEELAPPRPPAVEEVAHPRPPAVEEVAQQPSRNPGPTWRARTLHRPALPGSDQPFRWSFLDLAPPRWSSSVETTAAPAVEEVAQQPSRNPGATRLLAGEYGRGGKSTRLACLTIEEGQPVGDLEPLGEGPSGMQGVTTYADGLVVSTSAGPWTRGDLHLAAGRSTRGIDEPLVESEGQPLPQQEHGVTPAPATGPESRRSRGAAPIGVEDLTRDALGRLWTASEHPGRRAIVRLHG
jgi:hypothetical protein